MSKQLFGTDGIRGVAGEFPLDERTVYAFGAALGTWAATQESPRVLIGMDTRESGPWLTEAVAAGLNATGAREAHHYLQDRKNIGKVVLVRDAA